MAFHPKPTNRFSSSFVKNFKSKFVTETDIKLVFESKTDDVAVPDVIDVIFAWIAAANDAPVYVLESKIII